MAGDYTTIIAARYTSGRNYESEGKTYSGVRVLIMPKKLIGSKAKEIWNSYYYKYRDSNSLSIVSLMGDSGSGFYRIIDNNKIIRVGW